MMTVYVKVPGQIGKIKNVKDVEEIYDIVAPNDYPDFRTFDDRFNIGMYINDSGRILGKGKNFFWNQTIIYGTVVFVGLKKDGSPTNLSFVQRVIIKEYCSKKSLR